MSTLTTKKLVVFIDAQNCYKSARDAFFSRPAPYINGQTDPVKLANIICSRNTPWIQKVLQEIRIYTGRADATKDPKTYAAHIKQCQAWQNAGVNVIYRMLRYPQGYPMAKPQEKGVDVALAVDVVTMACDGVYDIGVIVSTDTDLKPAIEYVYHRFKGNPAIEVVAWYSNICKNRLSITGARVWCHYLTMQDYSNCADLTDYNI